MDREIKKRQLILLNRQPYAAGVSAYITELNSLDWIHSSLRLDGILMDRETARRIMRGELVKEYNLNIHSLIGNYTEMIDRLLALQAADYDLSQRYLNELHAILIQPAASGYRQDNPVLRQFNYNPPHFKELDEIMSEFFRSFYSATATDDPIMQAAVLHNRIIAAYPFSEQTETIARSAAQYLLLKNGFPPIEWMLSEQDYGDGLRRFLKYGESAPIAEAISHSLFLKLGTLLQLTEPAP